MIDRFEHVQRPIMINDATHRSKNRETLSLSLSFSSVSERAIATDPLCFRDSFGTRTIYGSR